MGEGSRGRAMNTKADPPLSKREFFLPSNWDMAFCPACKLQLNHGFFLSVVPVDLQTGVTPSAFLGLLLADNPCRF